MTERLARAAVALVLAAVTVLHLAAISTENVNWDEFAQLDRAARSVLTGELKAGGRPGLAILHLVPLVDGCSDEIATVRRARWLWAGWTLLYVAGLWALLAVARRHARHPWHGAAMAVGLLVMVPVFLRWSLQVRSDQPALAAALWGGVALVASRRRPWLAAVAGALFGLGFLFSQKAVYAVALAGVLALGDLYRDRGLRWRRELLRAALVGIAGAAAVGLYTALVALVARAAAPPPLLDLGAGFDVFGYYRRTLGDRVWHGMLPTLGGHLLLGLLLAAAAVVAARRRDREAGRPLVVAAAVLALGWAVARFHAGAFPYFWMTLGLFPAAAGGYALEAAVGWLPGRRARAGAVAAVAALLLASGLPAAVRLLADSQRVQAESLGFIARTFAPGDAGFHPERAPFCRAGDNPHPVFFSQHIEARFGGRGGRAAIEGFLDEFRTLPVRYLLDSYRLRQFPRPILRFWAEHYGLYRARVLLPARTLAGEPGAEAEFEVLVPGRYRWHQPEAAGAGAVAVDGRPLAPGETVELAAGSHRAAFAGGPVAGTLWWAVDEPPAPAAEPFYSEAALAEYRGRRPPWPGALLGIP